jgi:hypothetical protein
MSYKLCEGVTIEQVDGQNVLITEKGDVAVLNETADYILDHLLDDSGIEKAIQKTTETYNTDGAAVRADVEKLIASLIEKDLIQSVME